MKVTATNWQQSSAAMYRSSSEEGYQNQQTESTSSLLKDTDNFFKIVTVHLYQNQKQLLKALVPTLT